MEACDEPHPENTSVYAVGVESNKTNAHAATWHAGAHSHILHNPVQVCQLLLCALLPLPDTGKELHQHVEGDAGYIFTCFGKLSSATSWVKALPHRRSLELHPAQAVPALWMPEHRLISQCGSVSCSSSSWLVQGHGAGCHFVQSRAGKRKPPAQSSMFPSSLQGLVALQTQADPQEGWHLLTVPPIFSRAGEIIGCACCSLSRVWLFRVCKCLCCVPCRRSAR